MKIDIVNVYMNFESDDKKKKNSTTLGTSPEMAESIVRMNLETIKKDLNMIRVSFTINDVQFPHEDRINQALKSKYESFDNRLTHCLSDRFVIGFKWMRGECKKRFNINKESKKIIDILSRAGIEIK